MRDLIAGSTWGWNDVVRLKDDVAGQRRGERAWIVGGVRRDGDGRPASTLFLTLEFEDGSDTELPEDQIELIEPGL